METINSELAEFSFLVLNTGDDDDDMNFWYNKAQTFNNTFSSIPDNIRKVMEAKTHIQVGNEFHFCHFLPILHWKPIEKEMDELPKGVFNFCVQEDIQIEIMSHTERIYSFTGIEK